MSKIIQALGDAHNCFDSIIRHCDTMQAILRREITTKEELDKYIKNWKPTPSKDQIEEDSCQIVK